MSQQDPPEPVPVSPDESVALTAEVPRERVFRGLAAASVAVVLGVALTVIIWRWGFIASITSLAIAYGAAFLYTMAAGTNARRGLAPLILLILIGVAASFFGVVISDLIDAYDELNLAGTVDKSQFIRDNVFEPELLKSYGKDLAWFIGFAALGIFGTIRQLFAGR
jgi:hypothetical protein